MKKPLKCSVLVLLGAAMGMPSAADESLQVCQTLTGDVGVGVDVAAVVRNENVQQARGVGKVWVAIKEVSTATGRAIEENPWKAAGTVVLGWAGVRLAQGKLDDDLKRTAEGLGLRSRSGGGGNHAADGDRGDPDGDSVFVNNLSITGNGNTVHQTFVVQQPQGSGTGQSPNNNSGSGGQENNKE